MQKHFCLLLITCKIKFILFFGHILVHWMGWIVLKIIDGLIKNYISGSNRPKKTAFLFFDVQACSKFYVYLKVANF